MYDVTSSSSFDNISKWLRNVNEVNCSLYSFKLFINQNVIIKLADEDVHKVLVGNKCDLDDLRAVSTDRGAEAAKNMVLMRIQN